MDLRDRISVDPNVCHGRACIRGTRVMVSVVLDNLAAGESPQDVADTFRLSVDDVHAALQYAAEMTRERIVPLRTGAA